MKTILEIGTRWLRLGAVGLLGAWLLMAGQASAGPPAQGVVVEEVTEGSALEKAGLRAGDVLLGWERDGRGEIASPFDWLWVEVEQAPRGTVKLIGERDGEAMAFVVEPGLWEAKVRPRMSGTVVDAYLKGRERIDAEQLEEGTSLWRQAAETTQDNEDWGLRCWLFLRVGQVWAEAGTWENAEEAYQRAWEEAREPKAQVVVREAFGYAFWEQSEWERAEEAYRWALEIRETGWGESLGVGKNSKALANVAFQRGNLDAAEAYFQRDLAITEKLAPNSLSLAGTLASLGNVAAARGNLDGAETYYQRALAITEKLAPYSLDLAKTVANLGIVTLERGDLEAAETYFQRDLSITEKLMPKSLELAKTLVSLGGVAFWRGDLDGAETYLQRALSINERLAPNSLELATSLANLGMVALERGDLDGAESYFQCALSIDERLAPNSLQLAASLSNLGMVALERGDLDGAEAYFQRILSINEKLAPNSLQLAANLANLGSVAGEHGNLAAAQVYFQRALSINERLAPNSFHVVSTLNNLGSVAHKRGDLGVAEAYLQRALSISEKLAPNSLQLVVPLRNLGNVAFDRGDLDGANAFYQRVLSITEKLAPNSLQLAVTLDNLGTAASTRGDLAAASDYYKRALSIIEKLAPNSLQLAGILNNLGNVAYAGGDLAAAEAYYQPAFAIKEKLAPNSLNLAITLTNLGSVAYHRGGLDGAEAYLQRVLAITEKLAPKTTKEAEILNDLAEILVRKGRFSLAAEYLGRAIEALEVQISRLGVSREREGKYRADRSEIYRDTIEVLLKLNRPDDAFHTLERFRAGSLLAMLAERDLIFSTDVPEDLDKARNTLAWQYDRILEQMGTLDSEKDQQQIEELSNQLRSLQRERDDLAARIRKVSPRLADFHYPKPLTLTQAQDALDPGTVMLSYSVGEEETHVFVVASDKGLVGVKRLAIGEEKLRRKVAGYRHGIVHGTDPRSQFFQPVKDTGRELYEDLIRPVASLIEQSERVLIIPDGPLHQLPFSALIRESGEYLGEWKPVHFVLSATLYGELKRTRPQAGDSPSLVAAFGDPVYPEIVRGENPDQIADVRVRAAVKRGLFDWEPLPHTRREVEGIAALYPAESVRPYLGEEATEEQAKGLPRTTDVVHFAAHGHLDDRFPLNSAVVFTIPEGFPEDRDNGLLQAWEIFERVRIDADLVVLSACESALGEERGGEGLIGLTRAFQYAGARTVVASLWKVADEVTAELMVRFHRQLRAGKSKDAALQAAQIELIRGPIEVRRASGRVVERNVSAPYYWAAFQVIGDWR